MRDDEIRASLEELELPPQPTRFFDDLWELVTAREHAAAVRWRRISVALAVVAVTAITTATVLAAPHGSNVVDQTLVCTLQQQGGIPVVNVGVQPVSPPRKMSTYTWTEPAELLVTTGGDAFQGHRLFDAQSTAKGYLLDTSLCSAGRVKVPLARAGLPSTGVLHQGYKGIQLRCLGPGHVTLHLRLLQDSSGHPTSGQLAARITRTNKPLLYIEWSRGLVRTYAAPSCDIGEY
jgi:hypothetical protein